MPHIDLNTVRRSASLWLGPSAEPEFIDITEVDGAVADGALLWDVRASESHEAGHPSGARSLGNVDWLLDERSGANLVPANVISAALSRIGIRAGRDVVVYAANDPVPAFIALRALRAIGIHRSRICLEGDAEHADPRSGEADATTVAIGRAANSKSMRKPMRAMTLA